LYPDDLKYTSEHEWLRDPGQSEGSVRVGITEYAQDALGDIVFVQLPEVGETVVSGAVVGELESTKSVSEVYAPLGGEVVARNEALDATPELVNTDPYGEGWLFEIRADDSGAADLMDAAAYQETLEGGPGAACRTRRAEGRGGHRRRW
jgi:glycine cleavage system H protein